MEARKKPFKTNKMAFAYKAFKDQTPQYPEEVVRFSKELDLTETNSSEQQIRLFSDSHRSLPI